MRAERYLQHHGQRAVRQRTVAVCHRGARRRVSDIRTSDQRHLERESRSKLSYSWDFGDGQKGNGASPTHVYTTPGLHPVLVTVTDSAGHSGVGQEITVQVNARKQKPPPQSPQPPPKSGKPPSSPPPSSQQGPSPTSGAVVTQAPGRAKPVRRRAANTKLYIGSGGSGSGSGTGSGGGHGAGAGSGAASGAAGGSGQSAQGVAVGGTNGGLSPLAGGTAANGSSQGDANSGSAPSTSTKRLVGVLIDPSGSNASGSHGSNSLASAASARALAGGGSSVGTVWWRWVLGLGLVAVVMAGRALAEYEPTARYRMRRRR